MKWNIWGGSLAALALTVTLAQAGKHEVKTVESAAAVVRELSAIPLKGIPYSLLRSAVGVAIVPHVVKAGLVIDIEAGKGVVLVHEPNGVWSNPVFVNLRGAGVGGQAGIEATDLVLVFKTQRSLDRALAGKLTLGGEVSVAAGPIGRDAEAAGDGRPIAEIFTYSRSRGLFAGVSLEGSRLIVNDRANEAFYGMRHCRPADVIARRGNPIVAAEALRAEVARLSGGPLPAVVVPVPVAPPLVAPVPVAPVPVR